MAVSPLPPEIEQARSKAQEYGKIAGDYAAGAPTISDVLTQKVRDAYSSNQDIVEPLDVATQKYLGAPQAGREKYQDVFNPFSRERLVSQYVGNEALPMLSLSNIYGNRIGRIEDLVGAGTRGYEAAGKNALSQAELAQNNYENLFNEYLQTEKLRQDEERLRQSGSDGGSDPFAGLLSLLAGMNGNQPGSQSSTTEPMPIYSPGKVNTISPGGEWVYTGKGITGWETVWEDTPAGINSSNTRKPLSSFVK